MRELIEDLTSAAAIIGVICAGLALLVSLA